MFSNLEGNPPLGRAEKGAFILSFPCCLPGDECVSVSRADGRVSAFETPSVSFLPVISSPCRQSVSLFALSSSV